MKRATLAGAVALALALGFAARAESAYLPHIGCVKTFRTDVVTDGRMFLFVKVGGKSFPDKEFLFGKTQITAGAAGATALTRSELVSWEPVLAQLRTAAAAKVQVSLEYESSTSVVSRMYIMFHSPC